MIGTHANYNVPPGYLQPWVCFDIFRLFLAISVQIHVDVFHQYSFFLVMKYVKIYPRVALQMQSNLYAHRTSFAKCIFTYTSMSYMSKGLKFPYHNWKNKLFIFTSWNLFPYTINSFSYVIGFHSIMVSYLLNTKLLASCFKCGRVLSATPYSTLRDKTTPSHINSCFFEQYCNFRLLTQF